MKSCASRISSRLSACESASMSCHSCARAQGKLRRCMSISPRLTLQSLDAVYIIWRLGHPLHIPCVSMTSMCSCSNPGCGFSPTLLTLQKFCLAGLLMTRADCASGAHCLLSPSHAGHGSNPVFCTLSVSRNALLAVNCRHFRSVRKSSRMYSRTLYSLRGRYIPRSCRHSPWKLP